MKRRSLIVAGMIIVLVIPRASGTPPAGIDVYDGFETPTLSTLWDTSRFVPGAVEIQANIVRAGHSAAKVAVHSGDKFEAGTNGNKDTERAELMEARKLTSKEDVTYEQSFSMFIPTDFPVVPTRLVIAQWKQYCPEGGNCSDDSPVVALRYVSGVLRITHQISPHRTNLFETAENLRGRWTNFRFQTRFLTNEDGRIRAWINDKLLVDFTGPPADLLLGRTAVLHTPFPWFLSCLMLLGQTIRSTRFHRHTHSNFTQITST
jgi:hypothetical protein